MKEIKVFVKHVKSDNILRELLNIKLPNLVVSTTEGMGHFKNEEVSFPLKLNFISSKITKINILCNDCDVDTIITIVLTYGKTEDSCDEIIYVSDVETVIKFAKKLDNTVSFFD